MRRTTRCVSIGLGLIAVSALLGCADSTSPSMRAWERSSGMAQVSQPHQSSGGYLVASDSFGALAFDRVDSGTTVVNAPAE